MNASALGNGVDLVVVAHTRKTQQLGDEVTNPRRILPEMDGAAMKLRGLRRKPHDLVAIDFELVRAGADPFGFEGLDQARSRALVLDDQMSSGAICLPFSPQGHGSRHQLRILEPAAHEIDQIFRPRS